jgi:FKBP-type peptidyl-prolyl cis-trans isomerase 2
MPVKKGDRVKVDYVGTLDDGTEFDASSKHGKPLEFELGAGQVIPGFEKAISTMDKGQKKMIALSPDEAYGDHKDELVQKLPKDVLPPVPNGKAIAAGMVLIVTTGDGMKLPAVIKEVTDTEITLDLNHPLAGKKLNFALTLIDIESPK